MYPHRSPASVIDSVECVEQDSRYTVARESSNLQANEKIIADCIVMEFKVKVLTESEVVA